jgi:hypothetical protein
MPICGLQHRTEKSPRAKKCNKLGWETQCVFNTTTNNTVPNHQSQAHILHATDKNNRAKVRLSIPANRRRTPTLSCMFAPTKSRNHATQTYTSLEMMLDPLDKPSPVLNRPLLMGRFCHRAQEIGCGGVTDIGLESWPWVRWPFSNKECSWQKWKYCHNFGCSVFRCLQAMNNDGNATNDPSHSFSDSRVCSTIPCVSVEQTS